MQPLVSHHLEVAGYIPVIGPVVEERDDAVDAALRIADKIIDASHELVAIIATRQNSLGFLKYSDTMILRGSRTSSSDPLVAILRFIVIQFLRQLPLWTPLMRESNPCMSSGPLV